MFASSPLCLSLLLDKRQSDLPAIPEPSYSQASSHEPEFITVSNRQTMYRLSHGERFRNLLQPRDQVLEHQFSFQEEVFRGELENKDFKFIGSRLYKNILDRVKEFLVEAASNVVSVAFNYLCKGELEENEAKQYASKNVMLNVHAIVSQTIKAVTSHSLLKDKVNFHEIRSDLAIHADNIVSNVLVNLADNYPQASVAGVSPRIREVITELNRTGDEENDFIYTSQIKISQYLQLRKDETGKELLVLQEDADYTEFIMRVLNRAIQTGQDVQLDSRDRSVSEIFTAFNQQLFWLTQEKKYQQLLKTSDEEVKFSIRSKREKEEDLKKTVSSLFDTILETNQHKLAELHNSLRKQSSFKRNPKPFLNKQESKDDSGYTYSVPQRKESVGPVFQAKIKVEELWTQGEEGVEEMKKRKGFGIGQKIPASVRGFTREQISNKQFTARHSSILRILTKWAGYLEKVFQNSEEVIRERLYPFRNIHNELLTLKEKDREGAPKLVQQLREEYKAVKKKFQAILKNSYGFIGKFLGDSQSIGSFVSRYASTRALSSKVSTVLTSFMLSYTNILIHHLLRAGQQIYTEDKYQNINLVVFRVSDLLRSKLQCSESSFTSLLKTLYMLDSSEAMRGKFKLVRIKNKLDEPANNVMVNYLFLGQVQCELQIAIQEPRGKEKHFYTMSHFVYELTRGKFGTIAECAIMISQLDPMISACKDSCYTEKKAKAPLARQTKSVPEAQTGYDLRISNHSAQMLKKIKYSLFECAECSKLISNQNSEIFPAQSQAKLCFQCVIKKDNCQQHLNAEWRSLFLSLKPKRLLNFPAQNLEGEKCMVNISTSGEISLFIILFVEKEFKLFSIKVESKLLNGLQANSFNYGDLDYLDISKRLKKSRKQSIGNQVLAYLFNSLEEIPKELFGLMGLEQQQVGRNFHKLVSLFREFRQEMRIVQTIKNKAEIIKTDKEEWGIMDKVCKSLALTQREEKEEEKKALKYNRYKHLDLTNLKHFGASKTGLTRLSPWLKECHNLKVLDLNWNSIEQVRKEQLPPFLTRLSLNYNRIKMVDISGISTLSQLELNRNQISQFELGGSQCLAHLDLNRNKIIAINFGDNNSLKSLRIGYNLMEELAYLPSSLQKLEADRKAIIGLDFRQMGKLKVLWVFNGRVRREDLKNLAAFVELHNWT